MSKLFTALAMALGLATAASAVTPVAVWDGDFGTTEKTGTDSKTYTLTLNDGNTVNDDGYIVIGSTATKGATISWTRGSDTADQKCSVLIKYSSLTQPGAAKSIGAIHCTNGSDSYDMGACCEASTLALKGYYNGKANYTFSTVPTLTAGSGYCLLALDNSSGGTAAYAGTSEDLLSGGANSGLKFGSRYVDSVSFGGCCADTTFGAWKDLVIEAVAIFPQSFLSASDIADYQFPSERYTGRVVSINIANALNDGGGWVDTSSATAISTMAGDIPGTGWQNVGDTTDSGSRRQGSKTGINAWTGSAAETLSGMTFAWNCSDANMGALYASVNTSISFLKCYYSCANQSELSLQKMTFTGIPYGKYDVIVYFSGTSATANQSVTFNDVAYYGDTSSSVDYNTVQGSSSSWGAFATPTALTYGGNVLRVDGFESSTMEVKVPSSSEKWGIAAIQLVERTTKTYTATVDASKDFSELTWDPAKPAAGFEENATLDIVTTAAATLTLDEDVTVKEIRFKGSAALTLAITNQTIAAACDFSGTTGGVTINATGMTGTELAKNAVAGAPYSKWLIKGTVTGTPTVTCPATMPTDYTIASETLADYGIRLIVTAPSVAQFGSININFVGNKSKSTTDSNAKVGSLTTSVGGYPVVGTSWNDLEAKAYTTTVTKYVNSSGQTVETGNMSVAISQVANAYGSGAANNMLITGYIDDGSHPIVQISNIPFAKYRVIVYRATDTGSTTFSAAQIGTTSSDVKIYYGPTSSDTTGGKTLIGSTETVWGKSDYRTSYIEGVNYIVSDVLEGTAGSATAYIYSHKHSGRAGVAAIQIVEVGQYISKTDYAAEVTEAGTFDIEDLSWGKTFSPTANDSATITIGSGVTGEVVINLTDSTMAIDYIKVISAGTATVRFTGNAPASINTWNLSETVGTSTIGFATGTAAVLSGTNTVLPEQGTGLITMSANQKTTIGNNHFSGDIDAGNGSKIVGPSTSTLVFDLGSGNTQKITGSSSTASDRIFGMTVTSGTLEFNYTGASATVFYGRTMTIDGENAVMKTVYTDATGWDGGCTKIIAQNGGTFAFGKRDTCKVPFDLCGGYVLLKKDAAESSRGLDLYGNNDWHAIGATGATAGNPTVSALKYDSDSSANDRKVMIRSGAWNITVDETAQFDVYATIIKNGGAASGTEGKLVKKGAGRLTLKAANTYEKGTTLEAGTLTVENAASLGTAGIETSSGATLEFNIADEASVSTVISGAGRIRKVGTGTTTLTGANTYSGGTTVSAGTLKLSGDGAIGTGNYTVNSGATLDLGLVRPTGALVSTSEGTVNITISDEDKATLDAGSTVETLTISGDSFSGTLKVFDSTGAAYEIDDLTYSGGKIVIKKKEGARMSPYSTTNPTTGDWTAATWTDATTPTALNVRSEDWANKVSANIAVESGTTALTADRVLTLGTVDIANAGTLTLADSGENTITADAIDDSDSTGTTTIGFAPGAANVTAGADTILNTVGTGTLTIDTGKKLTVKGGTVTYSKTTNNGTLAFQGGTEETPINYVADCAKDADLGTMTLAESTYVKNTVSDNHLHHVTGAGASSYYEMTKSANGFGTTTGTQFRNLTFVSAAISGQKHWVERANSFDSTVNLVVKSGEFYLYGYDPTIGTLSGTGAVTGGRTLTITPTANANFEGLSSCAFVIAAGDGVQTLSGAYTGALTVNSGASVALSGSANPSSITSAGTVTVPAGQLTHDVTLTADTAVLNVTGTAEQEEYVITTGTFTQGEGTVQLNGEELSGYKISGNKIIKDYEPRNVYAQSGTTEFTDDTLVLTEKGGSETTKLRNNDTLYICDAMTVKFNQTAVLAGIVIDAPSSATVTVNNGDSTGYYTFDGMTVTITSGTLKLNNGNHGNPKVKDTTFTIGASGTLTNYGWPQIDGTLTINNETDTTIFTGNNPALDGSGTIAKTGAGKLTLGARPQGQPITINAGTVSIVHYNANSSVGAVTGAGTLEIAANAVVTATSVATPVIGSGTLVCSGYLPDSTLQTSLKANTWTGTVWLKNKTEITNIDFDNYANSGSKIKLSGIQAYTVATTKTYAAAEFILENDSYSYGLNINNGGSSVTTTFKKLSGSGKLLCSGGSTQGLVFLDVSEFAGSVDASTKKVAFGNTTSDTAGKLVLADNTTATVASGETWTTTAGIVVNGTLNYNGTLTGTVSGSGTVIVDGALPAEAHKADFQADAWTGTVWIKNYTQEGAVFDEFGNANSKIRFTGVKGYFSYGTPATTLTVDLVDNGDTRALEVTDGSEGKNYSFAKITGSGSFNVSSVHTGNFVVQVEDVSDYTGKLTSLASTTPSDEATTGFPIYVGEGTPTCGNTPKITVADGATIRSGCGWEAAAVEFGAAVTIKGAVGDVVVSGITTEPTLNTVVTLVNPSDDEVLGYYTLAYENNEVKVGGTALTRLGWDAAQTAWTNGVGEVVSPITSSHILAAKDGDSVTFSAATAPYAFTMPASGTVALTDPSNLTVAELVIPSGATLELRDNAETPGIASFAGGGTIKLDKAESNFDGVPSSTQLAKFTGTLLVANGRLIIRSAYSNTAFALEAAESGTIYVTTAITIANNITASGSGWGSSGLEVAPLRAEQGATLSGSVTLNGCPKLAIYNNNLTISGTLTAAEGFTQIASFNTAKLICANPQNYSVGGTVTFSQGTLNYGNVANNAQGYPNATYKFGDTLVMASGTTLYLQLGNQGAIDNSNSKKYNITSKVELAGATVNSQDGGYQFAELSVTGNSTYNPSWDKEHIFHKLTGSANITLQGGSAAYTINAGTYSGTITYSAGNRLKTVGTALAAATVNMNSSTIELTADNVVGLLKMGTTSCLKNSVATLASGTTLDLNNKATTASITLAGGTLVNNGNEVGKNNIQTPTISVTANSEIGGTGNFSMIASGYGASTLNLNANTLTKTGNNTFYLCNTTVNGTGTLAINAGTVSMYDGSKATSRTNTFAQATLALNEGGTLTVPENYVLSLNGLTVNGGTLSNSGSIRDLAVLGGTVDFGTIGGTVAFADAVTIASGTTTLSEATATALADKAVTVASGATLNLGAQRNMTLTELEGGSTVKAVLTEAETGGEATSVTLFTCTTVAETATVFVTDAQNRKYEVTVEEGVYTVDPTSPLDVAKIGETTYKSVTLAFAAVQEGETVTLIADANEPLTAPALAFTLALDGHTLDGSLALADNGVLTLTYGTDGALSAPVTGSGTLVCDGYLPDTTLQTSLQATAWTGTLWLENKTDVAELELDVFGNANSTIRLTGMKGYFNTAAHKTETVTFPGTLEVTNTDSTGTDKTYALDISDGWSGSTMTFGALAGDGLIKSSTSSATPLFVFNDASEFTGSITASNVKFRIGTGTDTQDNGSIQICADATATIASGKTWSAGGGFLINGTLNDNGTLTSAVKGSGTIDMSARTEYPSASSKPSSLTGWTGTVIFPATAADVGDLSSRLNAWGCVGSTIELKNVGTTGSKSTGQGTYFNGSVTVNPKVILTGTLYLNNGNSNTTGVFKELSGSGTLNLEWSAGNYTQKINKLTDFTGSLNANTDKSAITIDELALDEEPSVNEKLVGSTTGAKVTITKISVDGGELQDPPPLQIRTDGIYKTLTTWVATVGDDRYATIKDAIDAVEAEGSGKTLNDIVVTDETAEVPEGYKLQDHKIIKLSDQTAYIVQTAKYYDTLVNAYKAVEDGQTINLLKAATGTAAQTITNSFTLNVGTLELKLPHTINSGVTMTLVGDATTAATVSGKFTVNGTLKTQGKLSMTAENQVGVAGALEVVDGETSFKASGSGISGTLTVDAGAIFTNTRSNDALNYGGSPTVNVKGTLALGSTRWSVGSNCKINLYPGCSVTGAGEGTSGALDFYAANSNFKVVDDGANTAAVTLSAAMRFRDSDSAKVLHVGAPVTVNVSSAFYGDRAFTLSGITGSTVALSSTTFNTVTIVVGSGVTFAPTVSVPKLTLNTGAVFKPADESFQITTTFTSAGGYFVDGTDLLTDKTKTYTLITAPSGTTPTVDKVSVFDANNESWDATVNDNVISANYHTRTEIHWSTTENNWVDKDGNVVTPSDDTIIVFNDGDDITLTEDITVHRAYTADGAEASLTGQQYLKAAELETTPGATLTLKSDADAGATMIIGDGTLAYDPDPTCSVEAATALSAGKLASFTGTLWLKSGRIHYSSALPGAIAIKVTDGAQFYISGGTWDNAFTLSGQGYKKTTGHGKLDYGALRLDGTLSALSSVTFEYVDDKMPAVSAIGTGAIYGTLTGCGFRKYGDGTIQLASTAVATQAAALTSDVIVDNGTFKVGNGGSSGCSAGSEVTVGTGIVVNSGATVNVHCWTTAAQSALATDKVRIMSPITINNGTLTVPDGAHAFMGKVTITNTVAGTFGYHKGWLFNDLVIPAGSTFNAACSADASYNLYFTVLGGDVDGALNVTNNGGNDKEMRFCVAGDAFANGTLNVTSNGGTGAYICLVGDATLGAVTGNAAAAFGDGTSRTLTLTGGTYAFCFKDQANGTPGADYKLNLVVTGDSTFNGSGTTSACCGTTTVSAGTLTLGNATALPSGTVTVNEGGALDVNGNGDTTALDITLNGGRWINGGSDVSSGTAQTPKLTLGADSSLGGTGSYGMIGSDYAATTLALGTYTLTKEGNNDFYLVNTTVSGAGTIAVSAGKVYVCRKPTTISEGTVELDGGTLQVDGQTLTLKGLAVNSGSVTIVNSGKITGLAELNGTVNFASIGGTVEFADAVTVASGTTTLGDKASGLAGKSVTVAWGATLDFGSSRPTCTVASSTTAGQLVFTLSAEEETAWDAGSAVKFVTIDAQEAGDFGGTVVVKDSSGAVHPSTSEIVQDGEVFKIQAKSNAVSADYFPITANASSSAYIPDLPWKDKDGNEFSSTFHNMDLTKGTSVISNASDGTSEFAVAITAYYLFFDTFKSVNLKANALKFVDEYLEYDGYRGQLTAASIDDSESTGPTLISANFNATAATAGADTTFEGMGTIGTLTVGAGKKATVDGVAVSTYSVSAGGEVRIKDKRTGEPTFTTAGAIASYKDADLTFTGGEWTLKTLAGDKVTVVKGNNTYLRPTIPMVVNGGTVAFDPNGSLDSIWYGSNGLTSYTQTDGEVRFDVKGRNTGSNDYGLLIGYTHPTGGSAATPIVMEISGGSFLVTNSFINLFNKIDMNLSGTARVRTMGVIQRGGQPSTVDVGAGATFEIGSIGWLAPSSTGSCTFTLNGGTFHAYDDAVMNNGITVASASVISAAAGKTLTVAGAVSGEGAITVGGEGTVIFKASRPAVAAIAETATVGYVVGVNDIGSFTVPGLCDVSRVRLFGPAGDEIAVTATEGRTLKFDSFSGKTCKWDYEFENNLENSGTDTTELTSEGTGPYFRLDEESGEYSLRVGKATPYRSSDDWPAQFSAVMYGRMISANDTVQVGFGNIAKSIFLATGDTSLNEVVLAVSSGLQVEAETVCSMSVANAQTAKHLYVFTVSRSGGKTLVNIYLDGRVLQPYEFDSEITVKGGFQIGSIHGGVEGIGYAKATDVEDNADLDFVRVYSEILTPETIAAMAEEYPYESPNDTFTRTLTGAEGALWDSANAWTVNGETVAAPAKNGIIELSATADSTLAVNLYGDTPFESMTFGGEGTITLTNAVGTTGKVAPTGMIDVNTDVTVAYDAFNAQGTPITVAAGKTLTFDMSTVKLDSVPGDMTFDLTGYVTLGENANVTWIEPAAVEGWTASFARNAQSGHYEMTVTLDTSKIFGTYVTGLHISEICPKPDYDDRDPNGRTSGWIELVNYGPDAVNLGEYKIVRSNIGKASKSKDTQMSYLCDLVLEAGERTVVYTSEDYPSAEENGGQTDPLLVKWYRTEGGQVVEGEGDEAIMVVPTKVNPKKFPMVRLYKGAKTVVDEVIIPAEIDDAVAVALGYNTNRLDRFILKTPTKGTINNYNGVVQYGPEVNMVYGYKVDDDREKFPNVKIGDLALLNDRDGFVPTGAPFEIRMPINPLWTNGKVLPGNEIAAVTLEYRVFDPENEMTVKTVPMSRYAGEFTPAETNMYGEGCTLWTASIPAADLEAGKLVQYRAKVVDASGSAYMAPRFYNPNLGYEWYGAVVEPVIADLPPTAESVFTTTDVCTNKLQTFLLFADNVATNQMDLDIEAQNKSKVPYGARVAIYDTQTHTYYDNVRIDLRGQTSAKFKKLSHGLRFNKVAPLKCVNPYDDEEIEVRKTSFVAEYGDPTYLRQTLALQVMRESGVMAPFDYPVRLYLNGKYYQLAFHSNRFADEIVEDYYGLNKNGYSYKNVGELVSDNKCGSIASKAGFTSTGTEKKTPDDDNEKDYTVITKYADRFFDDNEANRTTVAMTNFNLAAWVNYLAAVKVTQEADDVWTNLGIYINAYDEWYNQAGDDTIMPLAYDQNLSFGQWYRGDDGSRYTSEPGIVATNDQMKSHPFYGGKEILYHYYGGGTMNRWNRGMETVLQNATYREALARRIRTLTEKFYGELGAEKDKTPIWSWVVTYTNDISGDIAAEHAKWDYANIGTGAAYASAIWVWPSGADAPTFEEGVEDLWENFIVPRRRHFLDYHAKDNVGKSGYPAEGGYASDKSAEIPAAQSASSTFGVSGKLYFTDINGNKPESASFDASNKIIALHNKSDEAIDMSGWTIGGIVTATFNPGTVIPSNGILWIVEDRVAASQAIVAKGTDDPMIVNISKALNKKFKRTEKFNLDDTQLFLYDADENEVISHEAKIGTKLYITLGDAFNGAEADDIVTLVRDVGGTEAVPVNTSVCLYGDTNTLTGAGFSVADGKVLTIASGRIADGALAGATVGKVVLIGGKYVGNGYSTLVSNEYHMAELGLKEGDYTYQVIPGETPTDPTTEIVLPVAQITETTTATVTNDTGVLAFSTNWLVKTELATVEDFKDDAGKMKIVDNLNARQKNNIQVWENKVLGLDGTIETSIPVIQPKQTAETETITFKLDNVKVDETSGAIVTYKVWSGDAPGEKKESSDTVLHSVDTAMPLPEKGVKYYTIEVFTTPAK